MPIALDPKATFEYVLEDDQSLPKEDQTVFTLRGLTVAEEARVADSMISGLPGQDELSFRSGTHQLTDRILPKHRTELVNAILERGSVNEDEGE